MFVYHPHYPVLNCPERLLFFHVFLIRAYFHVQLGASVEVYSDEEKNFNGLFFQDQQMKDTFQAYPELVCIDATYKLLALGLPTYLMLCEDSNGQSEIIAVCLLVTEDASSMMWMMETFKKHDLNWDRICILMADKDIGERDVLKQCLPNSSVLICLFHALCSFRREITCEKMGITSGQRTLCLELVQRMAYASTKSEYSCLYDQLQRDAPKQVVQGQYCKLLTSYAFPFVLKQMELSKKVKEIKKIDDQCFIQTSEGEKCVGLPDCNCIFRKSMLLPCHHIFALRNKLE